MSVSPVSCVSISWQELSWLPRPLSSTWPLGLTLLLTKPVMSVYKCTVRHLVTRLVEAGERSLRLELVSPRVWDISTEVTWFRVMLSSAAWR